MTTKTQAEPIFAAKLTPHRSLSPRGRQVLIIALAICAAIPGFVFSRLGAWPIVGFMGLDVLAVYFALRWSMRDGDRFEEITLWPNRLQLRRVSAKGKEAISQFNPRQVRLVLERDYDERTTGLNLRTEDGDVEIGGFLAAAERASFAKVFGTALRKARR
ncbi:MAG TPA: DUF2244 domain-containing protein [Devosiaceae bacterium]|jgi:uncharacterized membrane protein